jgi:hypothetical protein
VNPLYRIPHDIDPISSVKGVPTRSESPKVDKPPSAQGEKFAPAPSKPPSPGNAQGLTGTEGTLTSSFHNTSSHDTTNIPQRPEPTEMSEVIPPSPLSYGLGVPVGRIHVKVHPCVHLRHNRDRFRVLRSPCGTTQISFSPIFTLGGILRLPWTPKLKEKTPRRSFLAQRPLNSD